MDILLVAILAIVGLVLFWGGIIFLAVKFWRSKSSLTDAEKIAVLTAAAGAMSSGTDYSEPGPAASEARQILIDGGIDPNG